MALPTIRLKSGKRVKLGRKRPLTIEDAGKVRTMTFPGGQTERVLLVDEFLRTAAKKAPPAVDYSAKAMESIRRMYGNDRYGNCVVASAYHRVGVWSANDGPAVVLGTDAEVIEQYQSICGPGDNGCYIPDVMRAMRDAGLPFNGVRRKIDNYIAFNGNNVDLHKAALWLFGPCNYGVLLAPSWACTDCIWDVDNGGVIGGHDVCSVGYDDQFLYVSTWGGIARVTWSAVTQPGRFEEHYCSLSPDWYNDDRLSPAGVNVEKMRADLEEIKQGRIPDVQPPPEPNPFQCWLDAFQALLAGQSVMTVIVNLVLCLVSNGYIGDDDLDRLKQIK